jgi:thiamine phosphate synthase YjbQ (UPF0047 family)
VDHKKPTASSNGATPAEKTLEVVPESRVTLIDVKQRVVEEIDGFEDYSKAVYCSHHTTAGYFEQPLLTRLEHCPDTLTSFVGAFRKLFPEDAGYRHDELHLREELSEAQRRVEPRNADSHLTYIGSGLENCVTYDNVPESPVFFVELDGINGQVQRKRRTTVIGYNRERVVQRLLLNVPMSHHAMDSINLRDERLGVFDRLNELVKDSGIEKGRVELSLLPGEQNTGLTVNEYETLLMKHDLIDVLRNPLRFVAQKGYHMLRDPLAIKEKAKDYAKYDLVQVVNEFIDALHLNESMVERLIDKFLAVPASRFLRMKRSVSLLVSNGDQATGPGQIVQGTYQSPVLVQWRKAPGQVRQLEVRLVGFE